MNPFSIFCNKDTETHEDILCGIGVITKQLKEIKKLMATVSETLQEVKANLTEASSEILAKLDELGTGGMTAEDKAILEEIRTQAKGLADIVPNNGGTGGNPPTP